MSSPRQLGTRPLAAGALLAALALILGLAAYFVPVVGSLLALVAPLPLAVAHIRYGARLSVLTTAAASVLALMVSGPLAAMFVLSNCTVGLALGTGMRNRWPAGRTVLLAGATGFAASVMSVVLAVLVLGPAALTEMVTVLRASFAAAIEAVRAAFGEQLASDYSAIAELALANVWLYLGIFGALGYLMMAWVWYGVGEPVLRRIGLAVPALSAIPPAEQWHFRSLVGLALLAGYFVLHMTAPYVVEGTAGALIFQLGATIVFMGFRVQGFGLFAHVVSRAGIAGGLRTLLLIVTGIVAMTSPFVFAVLFWAGLADLGLDLRGFARRQNVPAPERGGPEDRAKKE